jgi:hypothetical protein
MTINKGDVWTYCGETIEWMGDMQEGDPILSTCMLINGVMPDIGEPIPWWATHHDGILHLSPPDGVTVTRAALGDGV